MIADIFGLILLAAFYLPFVLLAVMIGAIFIVAALFWLFVAWLRHRCTGEAR